CAGGCAKSPPRRGAENAVCLAECDCARCRQECGKVFLLRGRPLRSSRSTPCSFQHFYNRQQPQRAIDAACGPVAACCGLYGRLPTRVRVARSVPAPGGDRPPTAFRPALASQSRRSVAKGGATFSLVAAKDTAIA